MIRRLQVLLRSDRFLFDVAPFLPVFFCGLVSACLLAMKSYNLFQITFITCFAVGIFSGSVDASAVSAPQLFFFERSIFYLSEFQERGESDNQTKTDRQTERERGKRERKKRRDKFLKNCI